jgi:hypothetical protein
MVVTIYRNFTSADHHHVGIEKALERIKSGNSLEAVERVRNAPTKEESDSIKKTLPCVCFSGKFGDKHTDASLEQHSGLIVLDFDHLEHPEDKIEEMRRWEYCYAAWISPSGKGVKALVKLADPGKHTAHFDALKEHFSGQMDSSGRNVARLCFESYDPNLYLNENSSIWTKIKTVQAIQSAVAKDEDYEIFQRLLKWMTADNKAFREGERNAFVFRMACACCRYGIMEEVTQGIMSGYAISDSSFSLKECRQAIRSAYRASASHWNTAEFSEDKLVYKTTRGEVDIELTEQDRKELSRQNVVRGRDVKSLVDGLYNNGYEKVFGINIPEIDKHYKRMPGDLTVFIGYGNTGKSTYWTWYLLMRALLFEEKVAIFSPEQDPAESFYFDLMECYMGCDLTPANRERPNKKAFDKAFEWIDAHFFNVSPSELSPTPEVVKEAFLSLVLAEDVKTVVIDPFNQLANDYKSSGGRTDKYLETFLSDCSRFAKKNKINVDIVAHPKTPHVSTKTPKGDYPCPDQFSIADGTMWNNKADNILSYHRPFGYSEPLATDCEIHSKKIRRQKIVGEKGFVEVEYIRKTRRFWVKGVDYMQRAIDAKNKVVQTEIVETIRETALRPNLDFTSSQSLREAMEDLVEVDEFGRIIESPTDIDYSKQ